MARQQNHAHQTPLPWHHPRKRPRRLHSLHSAPLLLPPPGRALTSMPRTPRWSTMQLDPMASASCVIGCDAAAGSKLNIKCSVGHCWPSRLFADFYFLKKGLQLAAQRRGLFGASTTGSAGPTLAALVLRFRAAATVMAACLLSRAEAAAAAAHGLVSFFVTGGHARAMRCACAGVWSA